MDKINIFEIEQKLSNTDKIIKEIENSSVLGYQNVASNYKAILASNYFLKHNENIIYLTSNLFNANIAYDTLVTLIGDENVSFYPVEEFITSELLASSNNFRLERLKTIYNIVKDKKKIIVTNTEGIVKNLQSLERFKKSIIELTQDQIIEIDDLKQELVIRGYVKKSLTEEAGTFSVRGSVVDVFPVNENMPYRIVFFDNEIESIKIFDKNTQLTIEKSSEMTIFPVYELFYEEKEIDDIIKRIGNFENEKVKKDMVYLKNHQNLDQLYIYTNFIDQNVTNISELSNSKTIFIDNYLEIQEKEKQSILEITEYLDTITLVKNDDFFKQVHEMLPLYNKKVFLDTNNTEYEEFIFEVKETLETTSCFDYNNNIKNMINDVLSNINKTYVICVHDENSLLHIEDSLKTNNINYILCKSANEIKKNKVNLVISLNARGYVSYGNNYEILTPYEYLSSKISTNTKYKKYYEKSTKIKNKDDLVHGDYVVHRDYGIGIYQGIEERTINAITNDYIVVVYENESKLLIPVENVTFLEKYVGSKDRIPKLTKLGSKEWERKKAKVKEKLVETAKKLIEIQAKRELLKGTQYQKDTEEQKLFELDFGYIETDDQIKAIESVKEDMESTKPMDRLICGDVGFGKTEVAMRAAFKAVDNGYQVVYLAPTTVLTRQHFATFRERFEKYGVNVGLLNRFVSPEDTKSVIEGAKKGFVDIIIGTHRLLSKDINFKKLGLLIIDEEQRFGVEHKEQLKTLKANVDVMSLSATPIPRTLQMSLVGVRDLSLIETPPVNRIPIQTYVLERNDSVIREAIYREMGRRGQVFYLLNRVTELDKIVRKLKINVPQASVGVIHGRMDKLAIEEVLNNFLDKKHDVLVCTTIIETGIDIPNANTLIIEKADLLGLSQLYQIRGRVGRGDKISYAYLTYENEYKLSDVAKKRLSTLKEFTTLGSGYKIAMRDLSIRGAGDILGSEQSGFIDSIGIDLYLKMLNDAVLEEKGKLPIPDYRSQNQIMVSKHIGGDYVDDDMIKITMHKEINKIKSKEEMQSLKQEYIDRFGTITKEVEKYIDTKYLEYLAKKSGISSIKDKTDTLILEFSQEKSSVIDPKELFYQSTKITRKLKFTYVSQKIIITVNKKDFDNNEYIKTLIKLFEIINV